MKKIKVGNLELGDGHPKVCVPVMGEKHDDVLQQARTIVDMKPDIVEWRCDLFESMYIDEIENMLIELKEIIGDIPVIFTFRTDGEGGEKFISNKNYYDLNVAVAKTGLAEIIDVEAYTKDALALDMIDEIHAAGAKVIGSNHHFEGTPSKDEMVEILMKIEELGADICKLAVMPESCQDVNRLMEASIEADEKMIAPIVTMSMGEIGQITRVAGKTTKSAITFAAGVNASAPGQMSVDKVRSLLDFNKNTYKKSNIYIIGFMGTGKTTVSQQLAMITGMQVVDVDKYIEEKNEMTIKDMFEQYGEAYFRDKETEALGALQKDAGKIISCGGGIVVKDKNIDIMQKGKVVLLTATPKTVYERVKDNTNRPVLNDDMSVEHIKGLLDERKEQYDKAAQIIVPTDDLNVIDVCVGILANLKSS